MSVEIHVLGDFRVTCDGVPSQGWRPQSQHVLGLLVAMRGAWLDVDSIIDDLWRDTMPKNPRAAVQVAINRVRSGLGDADHDIVEANSFGYRLRVDRAEADIWRWSDAIGRARANRERGRASADAVLAAFDDAASLWNGPPYQMTSSSMRLDRERSRVELAHEDATVDHARLLTDMGDPGSAINVLDALPDGVVHTEARVVATMQALALAGRTPDAVSRAGSFRRRLRDELGLSPSTLFEAVENELLSGRIGSTPGTDDRHQDARTRRVTWRPQAETDAAARIRALVEDSTESLVNVSSLPSGGLTTFLRTIHDELIAAGQPGAVALIGRDAGAHSLRGVLTDFDPLHPVGTAPEVAATLRRAAERSGGVATIVLVDDADDLDDWSRTFLAELRRCRPRPPILVVAGTHRSDGDLENDFGPTIVRLGPLDRSDVERLLADRAPDLRRTDLVRAVDRITTWCSGDPLAASDAVDRIARDGTDAEFAVSASIGERLRAATDRLDGPTQRTLRVAAVIANVVDPIEICEISGTPLALVVDHLAAAVATNLLERAARPGRFVFADPLAREAIASQLTTGERRSVHTAAGRWFFERRNNWPGAAEHLVAALPLVPTDQAAHALDRAGRDHLDNGRYEAASAVYEQLRELADDDRMRVRANLDLAHALDLSGQRRESDAMLSELFADGESLDGDELASAALAGAGLSSQIGGQTGRRRRLRIAHQRLAREHPRRDRVAAELALELIDGAMPLDDALHQDLLRISTDPQSSGHLLAKRVLLVLEEQEAGGDLDRAARLVDDVGRLGHHDAVIQSGCLAVACHVAMNAGAWTTAETWIDQFEEVGHRSGFPRALWQSKAMRSTLWDAQGRTTDAERESLEAYELGTRLDIADAEATFSMFHLGRAFREDSLGALAPALETAADRYQLPIWFALRASAQLAAGNEGVATDLFEQSVDSLAGGSDLYASAAIATCCLVGARLERSGEVISLARRLESRRGRQIFLGYGGPYLGPVDWYVARAAAAAGDTALAARIEAEALTVANGLGARGWASAALRTHEAGRASVS